MCSKTYRCYDVSSNQPIFSSKGLEKRVMQQSGVGSLEKCRRVLNEKDSFQLIQNSEHTITLFLPMYNI